MRLLLGLMLVGGCDGSAETTHFGTTVVVDGDLHVDNGYLRLTTDSSPTSGPEIELAGNRGAWMLGIDVSNHGGSRDLVLAAKRDWPTRGDVADILYMSHNDTRAPTLGVGVTPPSETHRLQVSAQDNQPEMGTLSLRRTPNQSGALLSVIDSAGTARWWLDAGYGLQGKSPTTGASISIKGDDQYNRPLAVAKADGSHVYGFQYADDSSGSLFLRSITSGVNNLVLTTNGRPEFPNGLATKALHVDAAAAPTSSSDPCARGDITYDGNFVYVCVATNTWKRSQLADW